MSDEGRPSGSLRGYLHAALRDEWDGLERINRDLRLADLFTILNAVMGLTALMVAAHAAGADEATRWHSIRIAIELVMVGVIMDGVDGAVARLGKGNGPLGAVLDTLADALTFVTTSAVLAFLSFDLSRWSPSLVAAIVVPIGFYAVCGLLRLARFESLRDDGKTRHYFSGMPTPAAAVTLLSLVQLHVAPWVIVVAAFYLGILMVTRVRFPKLRGWLAVATVAILLAILVSFENATLQTSLTWGLLGFMALYVVAGPFYVLAREGARFEAAAP
ncbi:MAG: CDP-alcohol phosphatidyltransferase family protein [bacterium]